MKPRTDQDRLFSGVVAVLARDDDPQETADWLESLEYVCQSRGRQRAQFLVTVYFPDHGAATTRAMVSTPAG